MAVIHVRSGAMVFGEKKPDDSALNNPSLKVLVVGNFAGAANRAEPLSSRKHLRLDVDSFDSLFARLRVSAVMPFSREPLRFASFEEMHPDHLYDNVGLFSRYRQLKNQLQSPAHVDAAIRQLWQEGLIEKPQDVAPAQITPQSDLLDSLLSGAVSDQTPGIADQLIRQTIAPYLEPKEHPKAAEYVAAVDAAVNQVMRQIMHSKAFQQLEASWRSLDFLQRRLDLDRVVQLSLLDVSPQEINDDSQRAQRDIHEADLWQNLRSITAVKGAYDIILVDDILPLTVEGVGRLGYFAALAEKSDSILLAGVDAGLASIEDAQSFRVPEPIKEDWNLLRQSKAADNVFLASSRVLLRLPYGKATARIDNFPYEELPASGAHEYYLWGNGAYLILNALLQNPSAQIGASFLENLPLHVYRDSHGDEVIKPCAEVYLAEDQVDRLESTGFTVLQSVRSSNRVMVQRWCPLKA